MLDPTELLRRDAASLRMDNITRLAVEAAFAVRPLGAAECVGAVWIAITTSPGGCPETVDRAVAIYNLSRKMKRRATVSSPELPNP